MTVSASRLIEPSFWTQTLEDRMSEFAEIRELGAVLPLSLIHISEPTRLKTRSRMPSSA